MVVIVVPTAVVVVVAVEVVVVISINNTGSRICSRSSDSNIINNGQ